MQIKDTPTGSAAGPLAQDDIAALASQLQGRIVLPGDAEYAEARLVHFVSAAMPAMIVRAATTADVAATVRFARERNLEMVVRSGGHSVSLYSIIDGGVVLDLSPMKSLEFDVETRIGRLGAGLL